MNKKYRNVSSHAPVQLGYANGALAVSGVIPEALLASWVVTEVLVACASASLPVVCERERVCV